MCIFYILFVCSPVDGFFFFSVSWVTWVLAVCRAKKPGDARSLKQQKPPSRCPTNIMVSRPQIVGNIVLFWSLLWKHPRISFTWLENMSTHTKGLAIYCAPRQSVWACVCVRVCACASVRKHKGVHAYSHILPSAQQLSTPPRWLPESHHLHINLLQTSSPSPRVKTLKGTSKGCWDCEHRHWWSITPLSTTVFLVQSQMQSYFKSPPAEGEVSEAFLFSTFF